MFSSSRSSASARASRLAPGTHAGAHAPPHQQPSSGSSGWSLPTLHHYTLATLEASHAAMRASRDGGGGGGAHHSSAPRQQWGPARRPHWPPPVVPLATDCLQRLAAAHQAATAVPPLLQDAAQAGPPLPAGAAGDVGRAFARVVALGLVQAQALGAHLDALHAAHVCPTGGAALRLAPPQHASPVAAAPSSTPALPDVAEKTLAATRQLAALASAHPFASQHHARWLFHGDSLPAAEASGAGAAQPAFGQLLPSSPAGLLAASCLADGEVCAAVAPTLRRWLPALATSPSHTAPAITPGDAALVLSALAAHHHLCAQQAATQQASWVGAAPLADHPQSPEAQAIQVGAERGAALHLHLVSATLSRSLVLITGGALCRRCCRMAKASCTRGRCVPCSPLPRRPSCLRP